MVMPGDIVEMTEFQDKTISNSHYVLELMLPNIHLTLPNKSFYEKLYNRQVELVCLVIMTCTPSSVSLLIKAIV